MATLVMECRCCMYASASCRRWRSAAAVPTPAAIRPAHTTPSHHPLKCGAPPTSPDCDPTSDTTREWQMFTGKVLDLQIGLLQVMMKMMITMKMMTRK